MNIPKKQFGTLSPTDPTKIEVIFFKFYSNLTTITTQSVSNKRERKENEPKHDEPNDAKNEITESKPNFKKPWQKSVNATQITSKKPQRQTFFPPISNAEVIKSQEQIDIRSIDLNNSTPSTTYESKNSNQLHLKSWILWTK